MGVDVLGVYGLDQLGTAALVAWHDMLVRRVCAWGWARGRGQGRGRGRGFPPPLTRLLLIFLLLLLLLHGQLQLGRLLLILLLLSFLRACLLGCFHLLLGFRFSFGSYFIFCKLMGVGSIDHIDDVLDVHYCVVDHGLRNNHQLHHFL